MVWQPNPTPATSIFTFENVIETWKGKKRVRQTETESDRQTKTRKRVIDRQRKRA